MICFSMCRVIIKNMGAISAISFLRTSTCVICSCFFGIIFLRNWAIIRSGKSSVCRVSKINIIIIVSSKIFIYPPSIVSSALSSTWATSIMKINRFYRILKFIFEKRINCVSCFIYTNFLNKWATFMFSISH